MNHLALNAAENKAHQGNVKQYHSGREMGVEKFVKPTFPVKEKEPRHDDDWEDISNY